MKRILKPVTYFLAALYFLADAAFMAIAKPISDWLARHLVLRRLRCWIRSLRPYPSLALFSVPLIILEPVKPVAAYLAATGQVISSVVTLIVGELLKLVLVERLFRLTRDKLMKIPTFAWVYTKFREAKEWLKNTEAWQTIRAISKATRQYLIEMKKSAAVPFGSLERLRSGQSDKCGRPSRVEQATGPKSKTLSWVAVVGRMFSSILRRVCAAARHYKAGPPRGILASS